MKPSPTNAVDAAGNAATQVVRTVNVSAAPVNNPGNAGNKGNPSDDMTAVAVRQGYYLAWGFYCWCPALVDNVK